MTRTARYNAKTNTFRELPEMEKPDDILQDGFFDSTYEKEMQEYRNHLASLRTIPCHESCRSVFKDQEVYEEGKDYKLYQYEDKLILAYPLSPQSDDDVWNGLVEKITTGFIDLKTDEEIIADLKQFYTITPR